MDIRIKHLGKAYGEQQILKDFSCLFPEGTTSCLRGKSGCGTTTELRLLLGLESPDTGEIEGMEGKKIDEKSCGAVLYQIKQIHHLLHFAVKIIPVSNLHTILVTLLSIQ